MEEIIKNIKKAIKEHPSLNQELVSERLEALGASALSQALSKKRLRVVEFVKIAEILGMQPQDFFPKSIEVDLEKMSLIDLIKHIVKMEIESYLVGNPKSIIRKQK